MKLLWSLTAFEPLLYSLLLVALFLRRQVRSFSMLTALVTVKLLNWLAYCTMLYAVAHLGVPIRMAYQYYFKFYWGSFAVEALLSMGVIFELYRLAMAPLPGLQRLGSLMFRWAGAVSIAIAVGMACGPHAASEQFVVRLVFQLQQTASILTLCLLLFVTFAIRPMGLSFRSRIFGVGLGLAGLAATDLILAAWYSHTNNMRNTVNHISDYAVTLAVLSWICYFALPEPKRQLIVLPTTSPFLRWNQIALALGDAPGYVAVGGIDPDFLAPAEVEIMERTSVKLRAQDARSTSLLDRVQPEMIARAN